MNFVLGRNSFNTPFSSTGFPSLLTSKCGAINLKTILCKHRIYWINMVRSPSPFTSKMWSYRQEKKCFLDREKSAILTLNKIYFVNGELRVYWRNVLQFVHLLQVLKMVGHHLIRGLRPLVTASHCVCASSFIQ